jgi:hypothetical protein
MYENTKSLLTLDLSKNLIASFDSDTFRYTLKLSLSSNLIEFIQKELFLKTVHLTHLDLSNNRLKLVEDYAFIQNQLLKSIYLNNDPEITNLTFYGLLSLREMHISRELSLNTTNIAIIRDVFHSKLVKSSSCREFYQTIYVTCAPFLNKFDKDKNDCL